MWIIPKYWSSVNTGSEIRAFKTLISPRGPCLAGWLASRAKLPTRTTAWAWGSHLGPKELSRRVVFIFFRVTVSKKPVRHNTRGAPPWDMTKRGTRMWERPRTAWGTSSTSWGWSTLSASSSHSPTSASAYGSGAALPSGGETVHVLLFTMSLATIRQIPTVSLLYNPKTIYDISLSIPSVTFINLLMREDSIFICT